MACGLGQVIVVLLRNPYSLHLNTQCSGLFHKALAQRVPIPDHCDAFVIPGKGSPPFPFEVFFQSPVAAYYPVRLLQNPVNPFPLGEQPVGYDSDIHISIIIYPWRLSAKLLQKYKKNPNVEKKS